MREGRIRGVFLSCAPAPTRFPMTTTEHEVAVFEEEDGWKFILVWIDDEDVNTFADEYTEGEWQQAFEDHPFIVERNLPVVIGFDGEDGPRLEADQIFIDVGSRNATPDIQGLDTVPYLTNSSMMHVDFLPEHLIIVGGGYVGIEFAQMFRRFGSRVTIFQRASRLAPNEDADVSEAIRQILENEGVEVHVNACCLSVEKLPNGRIAARSAAMKSR